jgi:hypothetical protein
LRRLSTAVTSGLALALATGLLWSPDVSAAASTKQSATLTMRPQLAQPGSSPANPDSARSAMTATLRPVRTGRKVALQRRSGTRWVDVVTKRENGRGVVEFAAAYRVNRRIATYRVKALRSNGLPAKASSGVATDSVGSPAFTERFSGGGVPQQWSHRLQGYTDQRACARIDPAATVVANGVAALSVLPDRTQTGSCTVGASSYAWRLNGMIGTQGAFAFKYGYAAARIRFQPGAGQHAGFWLQPDPRLAAAGTHGAEIDTIEWYGNHRNPGKDMSCQIHTATSSYPSSADAHITDPGRFGSDWSSKYHVFSVEWTPSAYTFRIDGKQTRRVTSGVSNQPEYLILSLLSSDWELRYNPTLAQKKPTMSVDWVRVWSPNPTYAG